MKNFLLCAAVFMLQFTAHKTYAQFTAGNLVVEIPATTPTASPSSMATPVVLQEFTTAGVPVSTVNIPYTGPSRLTISGSASSEGIMTLSAERDRLVIVGYDADSGTLSVVNTTSAATARAIGTVSPLGVYTRVDTTHTRFSANNIRSGTAFGTNYIAAGAQDGIILMNDGSQISTTNTNNRCVQVYNNQLYCSASSGSKGVGSVGTGIPVTTGQTEALLATDASSNGPYSYAISPDGNTLYIADGGTNGSGANGGIFKYTRTGGTGAFTPAYTVCATACTGIAVDFSTTNPTIYGVPYANLSLISVVDAGSTATATTIATTTTTSPFRSVMFAPSAYAHVAVAGTSVFCTSGSTTVTFTGNPYATVTYNINGGTNQTITLDYTGTAALNTGTLTPVGGASTTYTYSVVNVINPSGTTAITGSNAVITVNPIPTVTVTGGSSICPNTSTNIIFTGTPNAVISYSANATAETITLNSSGSATLTPIFTTVDTTYTITNAALGICGQSITGQTTTVHLNSLPAAAISGSVTICQQSSTSITFTGTANGVVTYTANGSTRTITLNASGTGTITPSFTTVDTTYIVTSVHNPITSCTATITGQSALVHLNPLPTATIAGGTDICANSSTPITFNGTNSSVVTYTANTFTRTITLNASGSATITPAFTTVDTTYTIISVLNPSTTCTQNISGQAAIIHITLTLTPSVSITVNPGDTICAGTQITFTATPVNGGATPQYAWHNNGTVIGGATNNTYTSSSLSNNEIVTCVLTTSAVCATIPVDSTSDTITVNSIIIPSVSVSLNPGNVICATDTLHLTANPTNGGTAPQYQWWQDGSAVPGATNATFSPEPISNGDQFSVVMTNNAVCPNQAMDTSLVDTETVNAVASFTSTVSVTPGTTISEGEQANFSATSSNGGGSVTYQWYINGQAVSGATSGTYSSTTINNNDTVTCIVHSAASCIDTDNAVSNSLIMAVSSGINELSTGITNVVLYPNPTSGQLSVKGSVAGTDKEISVRVLDLMGRTINNDVAPVVNSTFNIQLSLNNELANGIYMLRISGSGQSNVLNFTLSR